MSEFTLQVQDDKKNVSVDYYDAVAEIKDPSPFPSPVNDPKWLQVVVTWFCEGRSVMEVGPGRGEFAEAVLQSSRPPHTYYLVDMSKKMLNVTYRRVRFLTADTEIVPVCADVDRDSIEQVLEHSLDRIIMNNAFQDIQPQKALKTYHRLLASNGLFRANVPDREAREKMGGKGRFFDRKKGLFYMTHSPSSIGSSEIKPLGYLTDEDGNQMPFYRIMKSYYRSELYELFRKNRFEIISLNSLVIPKEVWMNSVAGRTARSDPEFMKFIEKNSGYQGSMEIIAMPI